MAARYPRPTIDGPRTVRVGTATYRVPVDAQFRRVHRGPATIGYALTSETLHVFDQHGELAVSDRVRLTAARKYFGVALGARRGAQTSSRPSPETSGHVTLSAPAPQRSADDREFAAAFGPRP